MPIVLKEHSAHLKTIDIGLRQLASIDKSIYFDPRETESFSFDSLDSILK